MDTFERATSYNEWNVRNADTVGIFVHPINRLEVAKRVAVSDIPGYDSSMGSSELVVPVRITLENVAAEFAGLPIYTFYNGSLVKLSLDQQGGVRIGRESPDLYR